MITARASSVQIILNDDTTVTLGPNSNFSIDEFLYSEAAANPKVKLSSAVGVFKVITGKVAKVAPQNFTLKGRTATIGVRGTHFWGNIDPNTNTDRFACVSGQIEVTSDAGGTVQLNPAQSTTVTQGQPPAPAQPTQSLDHFDTNGDTAPAAIDTTDTTNATDTSDQPQATDQLNAVNEAVSSNKADEVTQTPAQPQPFVKVFNNPYIDGVFGAKSDATPESVIADLGAKLGSGADNGYYDSGDQTYGIKRGDEFFAFNRQYQPQPTVKTWSATYGGYTTTPAQLAANQLHSYSLVFSSVLVCTPTDGSNCQSIDPPKYYNQYGDGKYTGNVHINSNNKQVLYYDKDYNTIGFGKLVDKDGALTIEGSYHMSKAGLGEFAGIAQPLDGNLFGSEAQGIGLNTDSQVVGSRTNTNVMAGVKTDTAAPTTSLLGGGGTTTLNNGLAITSGISGGGFQADTFTLTHQSGGSEGLTAAMGFSADPGVGSDTINFGGLVNDYKAAYLDDNHFGVLASGGLLGGYLVTNDYGTQNDFVTYGEWMVLDSPSSSLSGHWVTGAEFVNVPADVGTPYTYLGNVIGYGVTGTAVFYVNFGGTPSISGAMSLNSGGETYTVTLNSTSFTAPNFAFDGTLGMSVEKAGVGGSVTDSNNVVNGQFFGNQAQGVGGTLNIRYSTDPEMIGVFKAKR
ncbi:hypothetical protein FACS1894103_3620 [Campylobacterota bacterium]|nr:hypothetical protein FACS1894103_3620 [Campylobacterota bacterium]